MVSEFQGSSRSVTGVIRSNPLSVKEVAASLAKCLHGPQSSVLEHYKHHLLRYNQAYKYPFLAWTGKCLSLLHESYGRNNSGNNNNTTQSGTANGNNTTQGFTTDTPANGTK